MNWLYYLAEANLYLSVFYVVYCLFLNKETHYLLNRTYLIFSCVISFILPVLQVGALRPAEPEAATISYVVPMQTSGAVAAQVVAPMVPEHHFTLQEGLWYAYLAGAVILLMLLVVKLYHLFKLMHNSHIEQGEYKLIYLEGSDTAFSFFNYLFIGTKAPGANTITRHELVHIRQKHSADILFLELLKIVNWFNPFIYLLQNSLKTVHEYIADEKTAAYENDAFAYSSFLVDNAYGSSGSSITHSFFNYNLLKRRIMMLHQQRSGNWARLKYLVIIPICTGLLCVSTLAFSKTYGWVDLVPVKAAPVNTTSDNNKIPSVSWSNMLYAADLKGPIIVANNKIIYVPHSNVDSLQLAADKILYYDRRDASEVKTAISKWGKKAKNGVFELVGNYKITGAKVPTENVSLSDNTETTDPNDVVTPSGYKKGYEKLVFHFSIRSIGYLNIYMTKDFIADNKNTDIKGGIVVAGFTVNDEHKLSDVHVVNSTNDDLNPVVTNSLKSFTGDVMDKPGMHTFLFNFSTHGHTEPEDAIMCRENGYDNHLTIAIAPKIVVTKNNDVNHKLTIKGYKYEEAGYLVKGKADFRVIIVDRNGEQKAFFRNSATPDDIKLLKDKYGYEFPTMPIYPVLPPPPPAAPQQSNKIPMPPKSMAAPDKNVKEHSAVADSLNEFYGYLLNHIRYPNEDKQNNYGGRVFVTFTVNANHTLGDVEVLKSVKNSLSDEVIRVLQTCTYPEALKPGKLYTVPVYFALSDKNGKYIETEKSSFIDNHKRIKTDNKEWPIGLNEVVVIGAK